MSFRPFQPFRGFGGGTATPALPSYRYYRFYVSKWRDSGSIMQLSEFGLVNQEGSRIGVSSATVTSLHPSYSPEDPPKANDGNVNTKMLTYPSGGFTWLKYDFATTLTAAGYLWSTANDATNRDPIRWRVEGSNDNSAWTTLHDLTTADQTVPLTRKVQVGVWYF